MQQVNFQIPEALLAEVKTLAKTQGISISTVMRQALLNLPAAGEATVGEVLLKANVDVTHLELRDRLAKNEAALVAAAVALRGLVETLTGQDIDDRIDKMSEWAKDVNKRLKALEEKVHG